MKLLLIFVALALMVPAWAEIRHFCHYTYLLEDGHSQQSFTTTVDIKIEDLNHVKAKLERGRMNSKIRGRGRTAYLVDDQEIVAFYVDYKNEVCIDSQPDVKQILQDVENKVRFVKSLMKGGFVYDSTDSFNTLIFKKSFDPNFYCVSYVLRQSAEECQEVFKACEKYFDSQTFEAILGSRGGTSRSRVPKSIALQSNLEVTQL